MTDGISGNGQRPERVFDRELVTIEEEGERYETRCYHLPFHLRVHVPWVLFVRPFSTTSEDFERLGLDEQGVVEDLFAINGVNAVGLLAFTIKVVRAPSFWWGDVEPAVERVLRDLLPVESFIGPVYLGPARVPPPPPPLSTLVAPTWEEKYDEVVPSPERQPLDPARGETDR